MSEVHGREQALLIIAHPDDESMFFGPCMRSLSEEYSWHVLCLSTGNADGLGSQREQELHHACVLLQIHVHKIVNDPLLQDGMQVRWDLRHIEQHVAAAVDAVKPAMVLTFDELGVSGHPNHISTHYGVRRWYKKTQHNCRLCFLKTIPLVVKFLGPLVQLILSLLRLVAGSSQLLPALPTGRKPGVVIAGTQHISEIQAAMQAHASQYRRLYMRLSLYTFMNVVWSEHSKCAPKEAAVLVPLFEDDEGTVRVVLTQRSRLLKKHAGEVAFPGGKRDPEDLTIQDTALREAEEEMSLEPNQVKVIATLSPVLSLHHLSVTPVIGMIPANAVEDLQPCPTEVESIFTVPLYFFLEEHGRHTYQDAHMGNFNYRIHHFRHDLYDIWGLTAGMLIRVAEIAYGRPADFDVHGSATDYSTLYYDGNKICSRGCSGTDDVCFLEDGKPEIRARQ